MKALRFFLVRASEFAQIAGPRHFGTFIKELVTDRESEGGLTPFSTRYEQGLFLARFLLEESVGEHSRGWHAGMVASIKLSREDLYLLVYEASGPVQYAIPLEKLSEFFVETSRDGTFVIHENKLMKSETIRQENMERASHAPRFTATNQPPFTAYAGC